MKLQEICDNYKPQLVYNCVNVHSFGCSFIFGTDLADDGRDLPYPTASQLTWPALISQQLDAKYYCHARGGAGNLQILDRILNVAAVNNSDDFFIIGWTWIDRFDYTQTNQHGRPDCWSTVMPIDQDERARIYYRELHSEYRDKLVTLQCMRTAIDVLRQKNRKFIMTFMDDLVLDRRWNTSPGITDLQDYVKPCLETFEGKSFLDWSRDQGFEISKTLHPLEPAHAAAAQIMLPRVVDIQNTNDRWHRA